MTGPLEYQGAIEPRIEGLVEIAADGVMADCWIRARVNTHVGWCFEDEGQALGGVHVVGHLEVLSAHPSGQFSTGGILVAFTADEWAAMRDALQALEAMA